MFHLFIEGWIGMTHWNASEYTFEVCNISWLNGTRITSYDEIFAQEW
jgi:hypothetical protein